MTRLSAWKMAGAILVLSAMTAIAAGAQTFTTLVDFNGPNGENPYGPLVQGTDGNFYGTTDGGGANGKGTFFQMTPSGVVTTLYSFCAQTNCTDGSGPNSVILATDGNFYGTTYVGGRQRCESDFEGEGCGTVFRITAAGKLTILYRFCAQAKCVDGGGPQGPLIQAIDGSLYGTTSVGGTYTQCDAPYGGCGTVFKLDRSGLTTVHSFDRSDGGYPESGLVQAPNGLLYGTTPYLGEGDGEGTVFSITPQGTFNTLHTFEGPDGNQPSGLTLGANGNLYGATVTGGANGYGTLFTITPQGAVTTLYNFDIADGQAPSPPIEISDGSLYGTTTLGGSNSCPFGDCGTIFVLSSGGALTTLYNFDGSDGEAPGAMLQSTNGDFYGTTIEGGDMCNIGPYGCGTAYSLSVGLSPFVTFIQAAGKVGQSGGILGQGFTGTSSVLFNGTSANFTVVSDTFLKATVPAGATTGYVTVTTLNGTLTSNVPFHVIK